ncbi:MAG: hypothetical protein WBF77_02565 [Sulfurimonadaceae bacterium]
MDESSWPQGTSKAWDTAPRSEPKDDKMAQWLLDGMVDGFIPPPKKQQFL